MQKKINLRKPRWGMIKLKQKNSHPQLVTELEAETLQAEGRAKAFVTFNTTPN